MSSRIATLPNLLTMLRMVLIPVFVSLLFYQRFYWALAVFVLAGVTDGLDGLLARRFNQKSQLGSILDPIADKLLLVTSFIVLALPSISPQQQPPATCPSPSGSRRPSSAAMSLFWSVRRPSTSSRGFAAFAPRCSARSILWCRSSRSS